ncbi:hypothetical protein NQU54_44970 [Streptomyces samsunensis]|uniref:Uncharacterized protein n=1 Tax=Streptomyces malaysiensis subsp. samsunensis TaxID=459658 RepID=A0A9X2M3X0_STRMQ|nr:hypothetical protein [Streptomyces samsunensis]MCQ8835985.1 hypothetical protein [Streptomyces samsunensis]
MFGTAQAVLAGDALLALAVRELATAPPPHGVLRPPRSCAGR